MKFGSVCSGIEAASVAFGPVLGWEAQWLAEIEPFPSAVLAHHYPGVPNLGDMTKIYDRTEFKTRRIDVLCGGTPCQSFSVAGLRKGLEDPRGNLALEFLRIADIARPRWILWENVPGVLSSNGGRDFGSFLGALGKLGYGFCYRVLDAQFFGVPQRRRRVFVLAHDSGDWRPAAAVLFEPEGLCRRGDSHRKKGVEAAGVSAVGSKSADGQMGVNGESGVKVYRKVHRAASSSDFETWDEAASSNTLNAFDIGERDTHLVIDKAPCFWDGSQVTQTLDAVLYKGQMMPEKNRFPAVIVPTTLSDPREYAVRRLTPMECERLQGFPDGYTAIPWRNKPSEDCADSPRYRAIGNSWAVPCARWIGQRMEMVEQDINAGLLGDLL